MYDKYYLSNSQLKTIEDWNVCKNIPLIIYGNVGIGKTSLANEILKDTILTSIDTLSLKNGLNLYEELFNIIKKNNITMMFGQGTKKRGVIIDDLDVFHKYDKKSFKLIINFINKYEYYGAKIIIICNSKFINNRILSKVNCHKLHLNYGHSLSHKMSKLILKEEGKTLKFGEINKLLTKSNYNLNIFRENIKEGNCNRIDNFHNSDTLYKDIIYFKHKLNDIIRIYYNEKITISLNLLENISKYIHDINTISEIYLSYEIADIIDTQYINYSDMSNYYTVLTLYKINICLKAINNIHYYEYINNKYISQSLIYIHNTKKNSINNYSIYLYLYAIKINKYNNSILNEIKKIDKKKIEFYINSFNYFYVSKLKLRNILKLMN